MFRTWWFNLLIGLMVGLAVGYALAELQPVPPAKAILKGMEAAGAQTAPDRQPTPSASGNPQIEQQIAQLERALAERPDDPDLMTALGNLNYDAQRWDEARRWYERVLEKRPRDASVLTDLAVAYRHLGQPERALELLGRALEADPEKWQALYNTVVVLHFDLHRHDEALAAFSRLKALKERNPEIPDLSALEKELGGSD